jgi:hypothetical protein
VQAATVNANTDKPRPRAGNRKRGTAYDCLKRENFIPACAAGHFLNMDFKTDTRPAPIPFGASARVE